MRFKGGEISVEEHARSERPSSSRNDEIIEKYTKNKQG